MFDYQFRLKKSVMPTSCNFQYNNYIYRLIVIVCINNVKLNFVFLEPIKKAHFFVLRTVSNLRFQNCNNFTAKTLSKTL